MFPHTAVGGVDGSSEVITVVLDDGSTHRALQSEAWQCGYFRWHVFVAGSFATNGGDRQNEIADLGFL